MGTSLREAPYSICANNGINFLLRNLGQDPDLARSKLYPDLDLDPDSNPDLNLEPDPKRLFRIGIEIQPKVPDPYGTGSATLGLGGGAGLRGITLSFGKSNFFTSYRYQYVSKSSC